MNNEEKENQEIYDEYIAECTNISFIRIGNTMVFSDFIELDQNINIKIKSYDEIYFDYLAKLDNKIDRLFYKQEQIQEKINNLTFENKITSDNMKLIEAKLSNKNILSIIKHYSSRESLVVQLNEKNEQYNNTFNIITKLHETILEIDEEIKNTKMFKGFE
jgi:hypothetical protein